MLHITYLRKGAPKAWTKWVAVLLLLAFPAAPASASLPPYQLNSQLRQAGFSGNILIEDRGRILVRRSYGLADRSFGIPVTRATRFRIASITKLFTSIAVLKLVEGGEVDLDAPFGRYLAHYPGGGADRITVRQLLGHMSGLRQFDTVATLDDALAHGLPQYQLPHTPRQLLELCCSGAPAAEPGARFDYNNADYIVLGQLIEAVTGETFEAALARLVLRPLNLRHTAMSRWDNVVPLLAPTYFRRPGATAFASELPFFWENSYAAGGLYSTIDDIARISDVLFRGHLLSPASMSALLRPAGDEYGLGLWSYEFTRRGTRHRVAKRPGSIMGANTMIYRLLDRDIGIVILANSNAVDLDRLAQNLAEAILDGRAIR